MTKLFLTLFILFIGLTSYTQSDYDFELSKSLDIYAELLQKLNLYYVDQLEPASLNQSAIEAALKQLDPYTVYYPESQMEDVAYMRSGKYGGIGAGILVRNDSTFISRIIKGYPFDKAELNVGDLLVSIDDEPLVGKNRSQISDLLQGNAGSSFNLESFNPYTKTKSKTNITREEIQIENVSYSGFAANGIAFVRLDQFKKNSATDIKKALDSLGKIQAIEGIIIDLRNNPGGLLIEAVNIIDLFVPPGLEVVATKGKVEKQNKTYKTRMPAPYPNTQVVVMVNGRSASASEIVAGGIQDLDRGVIIGQKSFGKGLVQNVMPLSYHAQVKITIAKYYIPSGRCIQAIDYSHKNNGKAEKIPDSLFTTYYTKGGRPVKDAGGILPDVKLEENSYSDLSNQLLKEYYIFDFANIYFQEHKDGQQAFEKLTLENDLFPTFQSYLKKHNFEYQSDASKYLGKLKDADKEHSYSATFTESLKNLQNELDKENTKAILNSKTEITALLKTEIMTRYGYKAARVKTNLEFDNEYMEAIKILKDKNLYQSYFKVKQ